MDANNLFAMVAIDIKIAVAQFRYLAIFSTVSCNMRLLLK